MKDDEGRLVITKASRRKRRKAKGHRKESRKQKWVFYGMWLHLYVEQTRAKTLRSDENGVGGWYTAEGSCEV